MRSPTTQIRFAFTLRALLIASLLIFAASCGKKAGEPSELRYVLSNDNTGSATTVKITLDGDKYEVLYRNSQFEETIVDRGTFRVVAENLIRFQREEFGFVDDYALFPSDDAYYCEAVFPPTDKWEIRCVGSETDAVKQDPSKRYHLKNYVTRDHDRATYVKE